MHQHLLLPLLMLSLTLSGCDSWPPSQDEAVEHFVQNRESFEALEAKLSSSKYFDVSVRGPDSAEGRFNLQGEPIREFIKDDPEWRSLFKDAGMWRVRNEDGSHVFVPSTPLSTDIRIVELSYRHDVSGKSDLKACRAEFEELMCGVCGVELDPNWQIRYMWYPWPESDKERERLFGAAISDEQFDELYGEYMKKCRLNGLIAIGYEVE